MYKTASQIGDVVLYKIATHHLPLRERAVMYGRNPNGLVYSYYYPEGEVGEYGGGVDPGEDPAQAAAREYKEETGYDVNNVRSLGEPYEMDWAQEANSSWVPEDKQKASTRTQRFRGSRTHHFAGDIVPGSRVRPLDPEPGVSPRFRRLDTLINKHEGVLSGAAEKDQARIAHRLRMLQAMRDG